ncbi:MAG: hypothetical protein HRU03_01030 [Nanoarchaeales archaeon]|nr:hypothetical protein [Nanoarchaeales archaeon]
MKVSTMQLIYSLKNLFKIFFFIFFLSILTTSIYSIKPLITIDEKIEINYLDSYDKVSIQVQGVLKITNPSLIDTIYEISIPIKLDSLIGFSKQDRFEGNFSFDYNKIKAQLLKPNQSISVGYTFYGIVNYDIAKNTTSKNISFLEYYSSDFILLSNIVINLQKATRGNNLINGSKYEYQTTFENTSRRIVSTNVQNPTGFDLDLRELKIYKTHSANPMYGGGDLIKTFKDILFLPYGQKTLDVVDYESDDYSVYWVSSKLVILNTIITTLDFNTRFTKNPSSRGSTSGGGSTYFPKDTSNLLIKKTADKTLLSSGEEFTVTVRIINLGFGTLDNITLFDEIPANHIISDVSKGVRIEGENNLIFDIKQIEGYGEYVVTYTLVNKNDLKGVTYLQPASITHEEKTYYSDGILIISELLPDKKVYIQKKIELVSDEFSRVTITVKNLGTNILQDLLLSDIMDNNAIIKEISKVFDERGVWTISSLGPGEEWEVTYLIERNSQIDTLPNIFGVDSDDVFGTLIFSEEVITIFQEAPKTIEKVGMIVAVGLLVFYLLF